MESVFLFQSSRCVIISSRIHVAAMALFCSLLWLSSTWHPTPVLLPGESHGQRNLVGCSPWGCEESDTTERLHFHFSLSYIGEGNGNPLQCSCLENPRDGEPGGLSSVGLHRVGHDWSDLAAAAAAVFKSLCAISNILDHLGVSYWLPFLLIMDNTLLVVYV